MTFYFGCVSKRPNTFMEIRWHFISCSVYMIFYHMKWNVISVKMTDMKSMPAMSFKWTCPLNAIFNKSALIHFVSGKFYSHENLILVWNFILVKMTNTKFILFWDSFASIHVNTSKELTEHQSDIFNWNEISYHFEFISLLMWMYSEGRKLESTFLLAYLLHVN